MTRKHDKNTEDILKDIPNGKIIINRHNSTHENTIFNKDFRYCSDGRGLVDTYSVFPGIELSFNYYYANCFEFQHRPVHSAMQINPQYIWAPEIYLSTHCIHVRILP